MSYQPQEEYDEHVWLSLKNAKLIVNVIEEKLCAADPDDKDKYEKNLKDYTAKLDELDAKYSEIVEFHDGHNAKRLIKMLKEDHIL